LVPGGVPFLEEALSNGAFGVKYGGILMFLVFGGVSPGAAVAQSQPPDTTITASPPLTAYSSRAIFRYTAAPADAAFECRLDHEPFTACSPEPGVKTYAGLPLGEHTFEVRATQAGIPDPSPASLTWTVTRARLDVILGYAIPFERSAESVPVGWTLGLTAAITNHFQFVSEGSGDYRTLDGSGGETRLTRYAFLNGLHAVARSRHVDGFLQVLGGFVRSNDDGATTGRFSNHPSLQLGAGADLNVAGRAAFRFTAAHRFIDLDDRTRGEWRFGTGLVIRFNRYYE
jgi:hypothetical protein